MADAKEALIANRFTTATGEERKAELAKFISIKERRFRELSDELTALRDELGMLRSQLTEIERAERTEQWLSGDMDPTDPMHRAFESGMADMGLFAAAAPAESAPATELQADAFAAAVAAERAETERAATAAAAAVAPEGAEADEDFIPPVFPAAVEAEIKADRAAARAAAAAARAPKPQQLPSEFADDRWLLPSRTEISEIVRADNPADLEAAVLGAIERLVHALIYGLNQLRIGWSKVLETDTYKVAAELTAETFLDVKTLVDALVDGPSSMALLGGGDDTRDAALRGALMDLQAALNDGIIKVADGGESYRSAVVHAVEAVEGVAESAVRGLNEIHNNLSLVDE